MKRQFPSFSYRKTMVVSFPSRRVAMRNGLPDSSVSVNSQPAAASAFRAEPFFKEAFPVVISIDPSPDSICRLLSARKPGGRGIGRDRKFEGVSDRVSTTLPSGSAVSRDSSGTVRPRLRNSSRRRNPASAGFPTEYHRPFRENDPANSDAATRHETAFIG